MVRVAFYGYIRRPNGQLRTRNSKVNLWKEYDGHEKQLLRFREYEIMINIENWPSMNAR